MPVTVHTAQPSDVAHLSETLADLPVLTRYGVCQERLHAMLKGGQHRGELMLVAKHGPAVGIVWGYPRGAFATAAYVRLLLVARSHWRQRVGSLLLHAFEAGCEAPPGGFFALTEQQFGSAPFYRAQGYHDVGPLQDFVRPNHSELLLWKRS